MAPLKVQVRAHCYHCRREQKTFVRRGFLHPKRDQHLWIWGYRFTVNGYTILDRSGFYSWERAVTSVKKTYPLVKENLA